MSARKAFLDFQLDSLRGRRVLGRFTVLDKVSNRRHGGVMLHHCDLRNSTASNEGFPV